MSFADFLEDFFAGFFVERVVFFAAGFLSSIGSSGFSRVTCKMPSSLSSLSSSWSLGRRRKPATLGVTAATVDFLVDVVDARSLLGVLTLILGE